MCFLHVAIPLAFNHWWHCQLQSIVTMLTHVWYLGHRQTGLRKHQMAVQ